MIFSIGAGGRLDCVYALGATRGVERLHPGNPKARTSSPTRDRL